MPKKHKKKKERKSLPEEAVAVSRNIFTLLQLEKFLRGQIAEKNFLKIWKEWGVIARGPEIETTKLHPA